MNTQPLDLGSGVAKLCDACQGAVIDDSDKKFTETLDDEGNPYLRPRELIVWSGLRWEDTLPDLPLLSESSLHGCDFCTFLRDIILCADTNDATQRELGLRLEDMVERQVSIRGFYTYENGTRGNLDALIIDVSFSETQHHLCLYCRAEGVAGSEDIAKWIRLRQPSDQFYLNSRGVDWVNERLKECRTEHRHVSMGDSFLPERLLDVQGPKARLVSRRDYQDSRPSYAALSYCWGSKEDAASQLTATKSSLIDRQTAIHHHELTEVLKDAVSVTKELTIPYLWVDALCILQDDASDWERQCVDMTRIYGNAVLTICAASSKSCHQGFLHQRDKRVLVPFQSKRRSTANGTYSLQFKYASYDRWNLIGSTRRDVVLSHWGGRGWTFQEKMSSTRMLVFGNIGLQYLCQQTGSMMDEEDWWVEDVPLCELLDWDIDDVYEEWNKVLEGYSTLGRQSFTVTTDFLPALSGVARHYSQSLQDEYIAGLWKRRLFRGLMWHRDPFNRLANLPDHAAHLSELTSPDQPYIAPSWSPLKGRARVSMWFPYQGLDYSSLQQEAEVCNAEVVLAGENPYGAIKDGSLRIRSLGLDLAALDRGRLKVTLGLGSYYSWKLTCDDSVVGVFDLDFKYTPWAWNEPMDAMNEREMGAILSDIGSFTWVILGSCKANARFLAPWCRLLAWGRGVFGLILHRVPDSDSFFRVGTFALDVPYHHRSGRRIFEREGKVMDVTVI